MRQYEMMIILDPETDERTLQGTLEKLLAVVPSEGGTLDKVDILGKRRLAYPINKKSEGIYVVVYMTATPATAQELDRQLGLNESIMRTKLLRFEPVAVTEA
ncbi:30S ribosomal protein S6 [Arcanobacterium buesumense]|uniref:Small ribosomal subunit protein bS6 n=1 Tax=Arcanobacterium buesumense TaxID=2722751 RepID=A0A6H2ENE8_9ACTO|nr:30S ribosomal protein S6 [Arcanobacterium buesumense]QJC22597.1 30S ribosomal protein S6 [Arcanobacterium buesumense]